METLPGSKNLDHPNMWSKKDLEYFESITFTNLNYRNIPHFFKEYRKALKRSSNPEAKFLLEEVIFHEKQYTWAYNSVNTR